MVFKFLYLDLVIRREWPKWAGMIRNSWNSGVWLECLGIVGITRLGGMFRNGWNHWVWICLRILGIVEKARMSGVTRKANEMAGNYRNITGISWNNWNDR